MPKTSAPKRDTLIPVRLAQGTVARLTEDAAHIERSRADTAAIRLAEFYAAINKDKQPDGLDVAMTA